MDNLIFFVSFTYIDESSSVALKSTKSGLFKTIIFPVKISSNWVALIFILVVPSDNNLIDFCVFIVAIDVSKISTIS